MHSIVQIPNWRQDFNSHFLIIVTISKILKKLLWSAYISFFVNLEKIKTETARIQRQNIFIISNRLFGTHGRAGNTFWRQISLKNGSKCTLLVKFQWHRTPIFCWGKIPSLKLNKKYINFPRTNPPSWKVPFL